MDAKTAKPIETNDELLAVARAETAKNLQPAETNDELLANARAEHAQAARVGGEIVTDRDIATVFAVRRRSLAMDVARTEALLRIAEREAFVAKAVFDAYEINPGSGELAHTGS